MIDSLFKYIQMMHLLQSCTVRARSENMKRGSSLKRRPTLTCSSGETRTWSLPVLMRRLGLAKTWRRSWRAWRYLREMSLMFRQEPFMH
jgi:hypothetical protein